VARLLRRGLEQERGLAVESAWWADRLGASPVRRRERYSEASPGGSPPINFADARDAGASSKRRGMEHLEPRLYFYRDGVTVEGPFDGHVVRQMVFRRELSLLVSVCQEGSEQWIAFNDLPPPQRPQLSATQKLGAGSCGVLLALPFLIVPFIMLALVLIWLFH
jgi:hypothetical protein